MAHKHNRRRIRPRSRNHNILVTKSLFDRSFFPEPGIASAAEPPNISASGIYPSTGDHRFDSLDQTATATVTKRSHNLYNAWQIRTQQQAEQAVRLEREQIKLFGGVPGDDVGLCFLMLEYFGGLDFIDA
jgi:hypothetical protein